jgi:hypothetical protein
MTSRAHACFRFPARGSNKRLLPWICLILLVWITCSTILLFPMARMPRILMKYTYSQRFEAWRKPAPSPSTAETHSQLDNASSSSPCVDCASETNRSVIDTARKSRLGRENMHRETQPFIQRESQASGALQLSMRGRTKQSDSESGNISNVLHATLPSALPRNDSLFSTDSNVIHEKPGNNQLEVALCIVTSKRSNKTSYLHRTVDSISEQIDAQHAWESVHVQLHIFNVDHDHQLPVISRHDTHHILRDRTIEKCIPGIENENADSTIPGKVPCKVRQQTLDVTSVLEQCAYASNASWIVLIEDDTELCKGGMKDITQTLASLCSSSSTKAHRHMSHNNSDSVSPSSRRLSQKKKKSESPSACPKAYKFAKSFSGTAWPASTLHLYTKYARSKINTRPVDLAIHDKDWNAETTENNVAAHKSNLLHHIGEVSTFAYRNSEDFREKYSQMREDSCFGNIPV